MQCNLCVEFNTIPVNSTKKHHKHDKREISLTLKPYHHISKKEIHLLKHFLLNIATGIVADENVNAHLAYENGLEILSSMKNQNVVEYSFKRSKQVKTIPSESSFNTKEDIIEVDPQLLFQRLIPLSTDEKDCSDIFKYELATFPSSLFEPNGIPRAACKSHLADTLWKLRDWGKTEQREPIRFVLDGGSLLHKIAWQKGLTFDGICK